MPYAYTKHSYKWIQTDLQIWEIPFHNIDFNVIGGVLWKWNICSPCKKGTDLLYTDSCIRYSVQYSDNSPILFVELSLYSVIIGLFLSLFLLILLGAKMIVFTNMSTGFMWEYMVIR